MLRQSLMQPKLPTNYTSNPLRIGKKMSGQEHFLAKKDVSYSPFHGLARWRSVAPD